MRSSKRILTIAITISIAIPPQSASAIEWKAALQRFLPARAAAPTAARVFRPGIIPKDYVEPDITKGVLGDLSTVSLTRNVYLNKHVEILGRDSIINNLETVLTGDRPYAALTGELGSQMEDVAKGLAYRAAMHEGADVIHGSPVLFIETPAIKGLAGGQYQTMTTQKVREIYEAAKAQPNTIVIFNGFDEAFKTSGSGKDAETLAQAIRSKFLSAEREPTDPKVVLVMTKDSYRKNSDIIADVVSEVEVPILKQGATIRMLKDAKQSMQAKYGIPTDDDALYLATELADNLIISKRLPGSAFDVWRNALSHAKNQLNRKPEIISNLADDIEEANLKISKITSKLKEKGTQLDPESQVAVNLKSLEKKLEDLKVQLVQENTKWKNKQTLLNQLRQTTEELAQLERVKASLIRPTYRRLTPEAIEAKLDAQRAIEAKLKLANATVENIKHELQKIDGVNYLKIDRESIYQAVSRMQKISVESLKKDLTETLKNFVLRAQKEVFGQDEAIYRLKNLIYERVFESAKKARTLIFVFGGPSQVGKTLLTEAAAKALDIPYVRINGAGLKLADMRGGGATQTEGSKFANFAKDNAEGIMVIDEADDAGDDVLDAVVGIRNDGFFELADGTRVDMRRKLLIITNNKGYDRQKEIEAMYGKPMNHLTPDEIKEVYERFGFFKTKISNRVDDIIWFNTLSKESARKIIDVEIDGIIGALNERLTGVYISEGFRDLLAELALDPVRGASAVFQILRVEIKNYIKAASDSGRLAWDAGQTVAIGLGKKDGGKETIEYLITNSKKDYEHLY